MTGHSTSPRLVRESATHITVTNTNGDALFHDDKRIPGVIEDARLIAAAPDLLGALRMVLDDPDALDGRPRTYECVREAIAKAAGGKP